MNLKKLTQIHKINNDFQYISMSTNLNLKRLKFRPTYNTIAHNNITKFHIKVTERFRNTLKITPVRIPF